MDIGLVLAVAAVLAVVLAWTLFDVLGRPSASSRRRAAAALGLNYRSEELGGPPETELRPVLWEDAPGKSFRFFNHICGELDGDGVDLVDVEVWRSGYRSSSQESLQTVALIRARTKTFPLFTLVPWKADPPHRVDIDLPCLKEHSLLAQDKGPAADLFLRLGPGFLQGERGWHIEGGGSWVLLCRRKKLVPSAKLKDFLAEAGALFRQLREAA